MTITGSLSFLDAQDSFDIIFGDDPTMLNLIPCKKGQRDTENTEYLNSKVNEICSLCRLHMFCDSVQLKYVETNVYDSKKMVAGISLTFSKLKWFIPFADKIFL